MSLIDAAQNIVSAVGNAIEKSVNKSSASDSSGSIFDEQQNASAETNIDTNTNISEQNTEAETKTGLFSAIKNGIAAIGGAVKNFLNNANATVNTKPTGIINTILSGIKSSISKAISGIKNILSSTVSKIVSNSGVSSAIGKIFSNSTNSNSGSNSQTQTSTHIQTNNTVATGSFGYKSYSFDNINSIKNASKSAIKEFSSTNYSMENLSQIQTRIDSVAANNTLDKNTESGDFSKDTLSSLTASEQELSGQIEVNQEALESVKNGDNAFVKSANENYQNSYDTYIEALNLSDNPVIKGMEAQIQSLDKNIPKITAQIEQLNDNISAANKQLTEQNGFIQNLSLAVISCNSAITDLQNALDDNLDDASKHEIKNKIKDLKNVKEIMKKHQQDTQHQRSETELNIKQLSNSKNTAQYDLLKCNQQKTDIKIELLKTKNEIIQNAISSKNESKEILDNIKTSFISKLNSEISQKTVELNQIKDKIKEFEKNSSEYNSNNDTLNVNKQNIQEENKNIYIPDNENQKTVSDAKANSNIDFVEKNVSQIDKSIASDIGNTKSNINIEAKQMKEFNNYILTAQDEVSSLNNELNEISHEYKIQIGKLAELSRINIDDLDNEAASNLVNTQKDILFKIANLEAEEKKAQEKKEQQEKEQNSKKSQNDSAENMYNDDSYIFQNAYLEAIEEMRLFGENKNV